MTDSMLGTFFAINVKPDFRNAFFEASIFEAQSTISEEEGVFQFHLLEDAMNTNRFYFYQVFQDDAALQAHKETKVFKDWLNAVSPMLEGEIEVIAEMRSLFPSAKGFKAQKNGLLQW